MADLESIQKKILSAPPIEILNRNVVDISR